MFKKLSISAKEMDIYTDSKTNVLGSDRFYVEGAIAYGSVSSGRELALSYVIIFKNLNNCCDQTRISNLVFSTVYEISFYLD